MNPATDEKATGEQATGEQATGEQATGEQAIGEQAIGKQASGALATGEQTTREQATGERAIQTVMLPTSMSISSSCSSRNSAFSQKGTHDHCGAMQTFSCRTKHCTALQCEPFPAVRGRTAAVQNLCMRNAMADTGQ